MYETWVVLTASLVFLRTLPVSLDVVVIYRSEACQTERTIMCTSELAVANTAVCQGMKLKGYYPYFGVYTKYVD